MGLIVSVVSGPSAGRTLALEDGQNATAGRRPPAQLLLEEDAAVSSSHLGIAQRDGAWVVRDLDSTNGTWRGREAIGELRLRGGEELRVGDSVLRFSVDAPPLPRPPPPPAAPARTPEAAAPPRQPAPETADVEPIPCSATACNSGLLLLRPLEAERSAADAARCMSEAGRVHLLIDATALSEDDELLCTGPLLDWLEKGAANSVSPRLLSNSDPAPLCERFAALQGEDACVLLLSESEPADLTAALGAALRPDEPSGGVAAIWQPRNAWMLLGHIDPETVDALLPGVEALLLEGGEGESWRLLCRPAALAALGAAGLPAPAP